MGGCQAAEHMPRTGSMGFAYLLGGSERAHYSAQPRRPVHPESSWVVALPSGHVADGGREHATALLLYRFRDSRSTDTRQEGPTYLFFWISSVFLPRVLACGASIFIGG